MFTCELKFENFLEFNIFMSKNDSDFSKCNIPFFSGHRIIPKRDRPPRVACGPAGLLPPFNHEQAEGQEFLYSINDRDYSELFVAYEWLRSGAENLRVLVSNERVRVISGGTTKDVVTQVNLSDLLHCKPMHKIESNGSTLHYIELISRTESHSAVSFDGSEIIKRPKVRCDSEDVAKWVNFCRFHAV